MKQEDYDVVIIGAGPGGLECARVLQDSDLKVLLIEQNEVIGPKTCAGGVTATEKIVDIPDENCKLFFDEVMVIDKKRYTVKLKAKRKVFDRYELGQYQLGKINEKKVKIVTGTKVLSITKESVVTEKTKYNYKKLVGADGSYSVVRKYLGLTSKFCQGLYYEVKGDYNNFVSYYNPKTIKSGYIWEFPHKTHNNVGIYFDLELIKPADGKKLLDAYIESQGYSIDGLKLNGALVNYDYRGCEFGNIFLVGDAAGLASRMHGGGINNAMVSGREVAMKILENTYCMDGVKAVLAAKKKEDSLLNLYNNAGVFQWLLLRLLVLLVQMRVI